MRALSEPSRLAAAVFLLLVVATIGAFFAAQRLKHQDPLLRYRASDPRVLAERRRGQGHGSDPVRLPEADEVTVTILDEDGGTVARLARTKPVGKGRSCSGGTAAPTTACSRPRTSTAFASACATRAHEHPAARDQARSEGATAPDRGGRCARAQADRDRRTRAPQRRREGGAAARSRASPSGEPTRRSRVRWSSGCRAPGSGGLSGTAAIDGSLAPPGTYMITVEARIARQPRLRPGEAATAPHGQGRGGRRRACTADRDRAAARAGRVRRRRACGGRRRRPPVRLVAEATRRRARGPRKVGHHPAGAAPCPTARRRRSS